MPRSSSIFVLFACLAWNSAEAQGLLPDARGSAASRALAIARARTTLSVLHIVAHPDDEDAAALALLARGLGARTMVLSLTRGEGGANLVSSDSFDALGVLRTLEYERACATWGVELFFTRAADYGYSKSIDEALVKWGGAETILRDAVRVVRQERPDIILSRFRGDVRDGHGHHTLAGTIAKQVFEAAGDPNRFPELADEGLEPWQPRKLYTGNLRPEWRPEDVDRATLSLDTGAFDAAVGATYEQIGRHGYGFHRSQGMLGHDAMPGAARSLYRLEGSTLEGVPAGAPETDIANGIDTSLAGLAALAPDDVVRESLAGRLGAIDARLDAVGALPGAGAASELAAALGELRAVLAEPVIARHRSSAFALRARQEESDISAALASALGVSFEATAALAREVGDRFPRESGFDHAVPGDPLAVRLRAWLPPEAWAAARIEPFGFRLTGNFFPWGDPTEPNAPGWSHLVTKDRMPTVSNGTIEAVLRDVVPDGAPWTPRHIWRAGPEEAYYRSRRGADPASPFPAPVADAKLWLSVDDVLVEISEPVRISRRAGATGVDRFPLSLAPPIGVAFPVEAGVVARPSDGQVAECRLTVVATSAMKVAVEGTIDLEMPEEWTAEPARSVVSFTGEGEEARREFVVRAPSPLDQSRYEIRARVSVGGLVVSEGMRTITAPGLGRFEHVRDAVHVVRPVDVRVREGVRVGYVTGTGDDVGASLGFLGVTPRVLEEGDLERAEFGDLDVILIGVRAYAVRDDLVRHHRALLDWVERGGVLVVQYQTPEFDRNFGPHPYSQGRSPEEVSEEDAPVTILEPEHPLLTTPNRITTEDFDGWIEQRGSKFLATWDDRYVPLLSCHDRDQEPQRGGLVWTRHGRGAWIYAAYAWYRQLPAGVPGAYRIVANLISHRP